MDNQNLKENQNKNLSEDSTSDISDLYSDEFQSQLALLNYNNLKMLSIKRRNSDSLNVISSPIRLIDFEMLEAELLNQGILPKVPETLSQILIREVSQLKWTTRHFFSEERQLEFYIDVPLYLLKKAGKNLETSLTEGLSSVNFSVDFLSTQELSYLEQFAAYLLGEYEEANNPYEKGLNLVLKSIKSGKFNLAEIENEPTKIVLPVSQKSLIKSLIKDNTKMI